MNKQAIRRFRETFAGHAIALGDMGYDDARRVHNGLIDRYPALVARCCNVDDVIAAVRFSAEQACPIAVRGGGHSVAGHGTCDGAGFGCCCHL